MRIPRSLALAALAAGVLALAYYAMDRSPLATASAASARAGTGDLVAEAWPAPNSTSAAIDTELRLTLASPVDTDAWEADALAVWGRWSGVIEGAASIEDEGRVIRFVPDEPFHSGEAVSATLRRGVPSADGGASERAYTWSFWIRPSAGSFEMIDHGARSVLLEGEEHVQPYGAYAGDYNDDGMPDLAIPNEVSADMRVMLNDGEGGYSEVQVLEMPGGNWPSPNEGADFNRDGVTDVVVGNAGNDLVTLFLGNNRGGFEFAGNTRSGLNVRGVCLMDLNGDGWMDVATANMGNRREGVEGHVGIVLNDGTGKLVHHGTIESPGEGEKTCAVADVDADGIEDLLVGAYGSDELLVFLGDGEGGLSFHGKGPIGGNTWMVVAGDMNGDGHVDAISANRTGNNVAVLLGDGSGGFGAPSTYPVGGSPLAVDIGDIDGDGDLDVVTSEYEGNSYTMYENDGTGRLTSRRTLPGSGSGSCAVIHDRDRDGDLDITGVDEKTDKIVLFENPGEA